MVMENIRGSTTGGEKSETLTGKSKTEGGSTRLESTIYQGESDAATIEKASPESQETQLPQLPQLPQGVNPLQAQSWMGILWQTRKNAANAGIKTMAQTVWKDGVPMVVIVAYPGIVCGNCGKFSYGTKCQYEDCGNYNAEVKP